MARGFNRAFGKEKAMKGWVLITGASKRIGRAIALEMAAHGWDIIIHYHNSKNDAHGLAEEIGKTGRAACLAEIDLSNGQLAEKLIPCLAEELGPIRALINNAALFEPDENDPDGSRHRAINAEAPRLLSQAFRDQIPSGDVGVFVNLLDASLFLDAGVPVRLAADGTLKPAPQFSAYARSKAMLADLTRTMAKSFAPQARVNGVAPMYVFPSPRQTEADFRIMAGDQIVSAERVAKAVRKLVETKDLTGEILTIR